MMQQGSMVLNVNVSLSLALFAALMHATLAIGLGPFHFNDHADVKGVNTDTPWISLASQKAERHRASGKAVLDAMVDLIERKGKVGLNREEQQYVKEVKAIWSGDVIPGIQATINDAKEEVETLFNAILDCQDEIDIDHEKYDDDKDLIQTEGDELKDCARKESDLFTDKETVCGDFTTFREELQVPAPLPSMEAGNQEKYDYLKKMNDYFCSLQETYEDKKQECDDLTNNYTNTVNNCTKLQGDFEQAVCSLKHKGELMCHRYSLCYTQAVKNYQDRLKPLKDLEGQLKSDTETAEKIECLWDSFDLDEPLCQVNETKVDECWTLKNDDSNLTIVTPLPPDPKSCGDDERFDMTPCTQTFLDSVYGSLEVVKAVSDRMKMACASCTEIEFTTTTTTTTTAPTTTVTTTITTTTTKSSSSSSPSRVCPDECWSPHCHHGNTFRGGLYMGGPDDSGPCPRTCSSVHGDSRYCGAGANYEDEGSISCVICVAPTTCPVECLEPTCADGRTDNGGVALTDGMCLERCSKYYGEKRYCGAGGEYEGETSIDCSGCRSDTPSSPTTTTTTTTMTTTSVTANVCPDGCKSPACASGDPNNGGMALKGDICIGRCSIKYGGVRYCGKASKIAYQGGDSLDCSPCTGTTTTTTQHDVCPDDCKSPTCANGDPNNGGIDLQGDRCTGRCSVKFSGTRYCGRANSPNYKGGDSLSCSMCKQSASLAVGIGSSESMDMLVSCAFKPEEEDLQQQPLWCWGSHAAAGDKQPRPQRGPYKQLSLADSYGCGLLKTNGGTIECWPLSIGTPDQEDSSFNISILQNNLRITNQEGPSSFVTTGGQTVCALRTSGYVNCWGVNKNGLQNLPSVQFSAISMSKYHACGVRLSDGDAQCWGNQQDGTGKMTPPSPSRGPYKAIAVGFMNSCAIRDADSKVVCWGSNEDDRGTPPNVAFKHIDAASHYYCGIKKDDSIACWGRDDDGRVSSPPSGSFVDLFMGPSHSCAMTSDGKAKCWGPSTHDDSAAAPLEEAFLMEGDGSNP